VNAVATAPRNTHRGWLISWDYPPIPVRDFDWSATHPDYDGAEDANDNRHVHAATLEGVIAEIDAWIEENSEDQR
jgi:hypothetical protein